MGYFDDIRTRVEQSVNSAVGDLKSYLQDQVVTPTVKVGLAATGNLTEEQIRAGKKAAAPPIAAPASGLHLPSNLSVPMVCILAAGAYILFSKKGRRS